MADPLDRFGAAQIPEEQRELNRPASAYPRKLAAFLLGVSACLLLWQNARASVEGAPLPGRAPGWRAWDDLAIAIGHAVSGDYPVASYRITNRFRRDQEDFLAFRDKLVKLVDAQGIGPAQLRRTIPAGVFAADERFLARRWDDSGRSVLLALGFRALGGVAPFLLPWLGVLAALPVLLWTAVEFVLARRSIAGAVFVWLVASSGFVVDLLMLGYSSAGFSLLAILLVVPLSAYALLGRPAAPGLLARAALAGCLLGWCAAARSVSLLSLPAFAVAILVGVRRAAPARLRLPSMALATAGLVLLLLPYAGIVAFTDSWLEGTLHRLDIRRKPVQQHDVWVTLWQGLGDFDRTKGHVFLDHAGEQEAKRHGADRRLSEAGEELFRRLVLKDIREDPSWFLGILARRTWTTVGLTKLWPLASRDGRPFAPADHPNQGVTDHYYEMTLGADSFRIGALVSEAPASALILPLFCLALVSLKTAAVFPKARPLPIGVFFGLLACLALAVLPAPVFITTASSFETQSFVLVHFLAAGLLLESFAGLFLHGQQHRLPARTST